MPQITMDKAKADGKPFFLWHNTTRMHVFTYLPPKYQAMMNATSNYNVEEAGMESDRDRESREDEIRRVIEREADALGRAEAAGDQNARRLERAFADRRDHATLSAYSAPLTPHTIAKWHATATFLRHPPGAGRLAAGLPLSYASIEI